MENLNFRSLRADEVELRVQQVFNNDKNVPEAATFLLYKDARCDMNILDEVVGPLNWKREHKRENANCVVSVWDDAKKEWVSKEDTGTESNTEAEKGLASDSFKRACFNWGIGRELYTAPQIKIAFEGNEGKYKRIYGLHVSEMVVENGQITKLVVMDSNKVRFSWSKNGKVQATKPAAKPADKQVVPAPIPEATTPEQKKLATAKTKAELRAMLTDNHWVSNTELVNYAKSLAANLPD
jgi:hypothetical protein